MVPGTLADHVFLHCFVGLPRASTTCRARRRWRWRAACRYDLPRRFLCLPRVRPPRGDGCTPQSPCVRLSALHCAWIASRSHCAGMVTGNVCMASSWPRRLAQSSRSSPAVTGALSGAQERRGCSRRGRAGHFAGGCAYAALHHWLQGHRSAAALRAQAVLCAARGQKGVLAAPGAWRAAVWGVGGARSSRAGSPNSVG